jgi:malate synthase
MPLDTAKLGESVEVLGPALERGDEILTPEALAFVADLHRRFDRRRRELLQRRTERQKRLDAGELPDFLEETRAVRESDWRVGPIPPDLLDRRVEITGPVDRKMIINALNSGARVFMADFEDATSPAWSNLIEGQVNLKDRWAGKLAFTDPKSGKSYALQDKVAVLLVRPRGWHLPETHLRVDGEAVSGSLFDFGLYAFHNARAAIAAGSGAYFYLPKMESHLEARLWNEVFAATEERLGLPIGTLKATVLIETLPAAFEMDEILYELREHIVGLNCGRWDYIFSFIKRLGANPDFLTPDRSRMVMGEAFLKAYSEDLIRTCHRRGAFAMGGMAAQIQSRAIRQRTTPPSPRSARTRIVRRGRAMTAPGSPTPTWCPWPWRCSTA